MLEIITGRAGSGKTHYCLNQICNEIMERPLGPSIILLLPEHMTYKVERQLANRMAQQGRGYMRCQIYGFKRFAYQILQETGGGLEQGITDMGRQLLLKHILDQRGQELKVFGRAARQRGFTAILGNIIDEFKGYGITPAQLQDTSDSMEDIRLTNKLADLALLYGDYTAAMEGRYNDSKDIMSILAERLSMSRTVAGADIWLDGFLYFNPLERQVLAELFQYAANIHVTFNMDDMTTAQGQWANQEAAGLFNQAYITRNRLLNLAEQYHCPVEYRHFTDTKRFANPVLKALENGFDKRKLQPVADVRDISLVEAATCRLEVEAAAADIIRLVKEKGYKWRDIGVLIRDEAAYGDLLSFVFKDYEIPFFSDQKRQCTNHPVAELIRSALAVTRGWRYEDVFACIKTGFFPLTFQQIDLLENYCLEFVLKGRKVWCQTEPWAYYARYSIDDEQEEISEEKQLRAGTADQLRRLVAAPLAKLQDALTNSSTTRGKIGAIYQFLVDIDVPKTLQDWADQAEQTGALDVAREHQQVWNDIMEMLDQLVEVSGDTQMGIQELQVLLEEGLTGLQMSLIPPGLDYVNIASFDKNALDNIKAIYILGANAGVMPGHTVESLVLSDADRLHINQTNIIELAIMGEEASFSENYLIYKAFTQAQEYLWVSYTLASAAGEAMTGAEIVSKIKALLPTSTLRTIPLDWMKSFEEAEQLTMLANKRQSVSALAIALRELRDEGDLPQLWQRVYNYLLQNESTRSYMKLICQGLFMDPRLDRLPRDLARALYARKGVLRGSVTRFERYNNCPFRFFVQDGLKLKERKINRFSNPELGTLMHALLKDFGEQMKQAGKKWGELDQAERDQLCHDILHKLAPRVNNGMLYSSKQLEVQLKRLEKTAQFALKRLCEFDQVSKFHPEMFERSFGEYHGDGEPLNLIFPLAENNRLELVGQIDRIDLNEDKNRFMIMDYKTGSAGIKLTEVYYGLKLQLLTYLLVANQLLNKGKDTPVLPAAILYFRLQRPVVTPEKQSHNAEKIQAAIDSKLKMPGWVVDDMAVAKELDYTLAPKTASRFIQMKLDKDGNFDKNTMKIMRSQAEFDLIMEHIEHILTATGEKILDGAIDIAPCQYNDRSACDYCKFKPLCGFDPKQDGYRYRKLDNLKDDAVISTIEEQIKEEATTGSKEAQ